MAKIRQLSYRIYGNMQFQAKTLHLLSLFGLNVPKSETTHIVLALLSSVSLMRCISLEQKHCYRVILVLNFS